MTDPLSELSAALAGRYRIEREIGAGGMATVYLAHDERHDRRVAVKVLRPELAAAVGAERFLREIKVTAALQHPHILPLYDSGEVRPGGAGGAGGAASGPGIVYYVMPYVEGESLRARLDRLKQLPIREALDVARAVASALDHAHHQGLIHRDIKPENILLAGDASDGVSGMQSLVADFGIAIAVQSAGTGRLTDSGLSVGTPAYMSPEQASAERHLGPTSDVYALGVVLYEMLTGETPFTGPTAQAVVARIMTDMPAPLRLRRATVSARVEAAVLRALAKSPADRFPTAAQFADALQSDEYAVATPGSGSTAIRARMASYLPWTLAGSLAIVAGVLLARDRTASAGADPSGTATVATHLAIAMPESTTARDWSFGVAASPDGKMIAFVAADAAGREQLYVKRLAEPNVNPLAGSVAARYPLFSPDGRSLAFFANGALKTISLESGTVTTLAERVRGNGSRARWTSDGLILFGASPGISRVSDDGAITVLTRPDTARGEAFHIAPQFLPGTRALMYSAQGSDASGPFFRLMVRPDSGSAARLLVDGAGAAEYLGDGRLLYQRGEDLFVATLDLGALTVSDVRRVLSGVAPMNRYAFGAAWAVSRDMLVYGSAARGGRVLAWVDRAGGTRILPTPPRAYVGLQLSPDARTLVTTVHQGGRIDLWVYDFEQEVLSQVSHSGQAFGAVWGPTAGVLTTIEKVVVGSGLFTRRADGAGTPEILLAVSGFGWPADWTRDGRTLVLMENGDITTLDARNPTARRPVVKSPANELGGRLSPDQRWLAYFSNATGRFELYVTRFPDGGPSWRLSRNGAREAVWSRDGRDLFYRSENGRQLLAVSIGPGAAFTSGTPTVLLEGDYFALGGPGIVNYDVSPDGKRFLMLQRAGTAPDQLNVLLGSEQLLRDTRRR